MSRGVLTNGFADAILYFFSLDCTRPVRHANGLRFCCERMRRCERGVRGHSSCDRVNAPRSLHRTQAFASSKHWLCCVQDATYLLSKSRNILLHDVPDELIIHAEIVMNQPIAHARHGTPLDVGMSRTKITRDLLCGLANDLKASNDRAPERRVVLKLFAGQARTRGLEVLGLGQHMPKILKRL